MKSLRRSILVWMAVLLLSVGVVSALGAYFYVKGEATSAVDAQIRQIAQFVSATNVSLGSSDNSVDASNSEDLFLIEIWDRQKNLLRSSGKASGLPPPSTTGFEDPIISGKQWRSYSLMGAQNLVRVSLVADVSDEQAFNAAFQVALPAALVIPLSWLLLSFIIDRIFAPLDEATALIRSGHPGEEWSMTESSFPSELAPFIGAINKLVSTLQANVERQRQFVSDAAHELRTPLTAISLQIVNLRTLAKSEQLKQRIRTLELGSHRANQLINKLLKLAQIDNTLVAKNTEKSDVCGIISQSVSELALLAQQRRIVVKFNRHRSHVIQVPKVETRSVVDVLIENAINYSNFGSEVEINLNTSGGEFQLEIKDQGIGIAEDELSRVFERFYRAAPEHVEGSGLGLAIAKSAAEKLGWTIKLVNRTDRSGITAIVTGTMR
ncbi:MAG: HAMP domain-containing sensor histidine kinase [Aestuariivirga sp.]